MWGLTHEQVENTGVVLAVFQAHEKLLSKNEYRPYEFISVHDMIVRKDGVLLLELSNGVIFRIQRNGDFERIVI